MIRQSADSPIVLHMKYQIYEWHYNRNTCATETTEYIGIYHIHNDIQLGDETCFKPAITEDSDESRN